MKKVIWTMKKNIFLDLDNVLIVPNFMEVASERLGTDISEEDITVYDFANFPENVRKVIFECFNDPEIMCKNYKIIEGVKEWVAEQAKNHNVYIITARNESVKDATLALIHEHFPDVLSVFFENRKSETMNLYDNVLFVDDSPGNILNALDSGIESVLVSNKYTKYNHHLKQNNTIKHVKTIAEIKEI